MKKTWWMSLVFAWAGGFSAAWGQSAAPSGGTTTAAPSASWTVTPMVVSQYMFRGVRLGGPAFQPTVELGYGALTAGVWANVPIKDKVPGVSDPELDLYGSYSFTLTDAANVAVGATWYHYPRAERSAGFYENTFEPSVALNYTVNGFRLTPKVYYDLSLEGATFEVTGFYAVPLPAVGSELDFTAVVGTYTWDNAAENTAPAVRNWGDYWSVGVAMPFQVSANGKVILGLSYAKGTNNFTKQGGAPKVENSAAVGRGVVSLGYSLTF